MEKPTLILDYPSAARSPDATLPWNRVVTRTLAGLLGLPLLAIGAGITLGAVIGIPQMVLYHYYHPNDTSRWSDALAGIALLLLAFMCDWTSVRWLKYALYGNRKWFKGTFLIFVRLCFGRYKQKLGMSP